MPKGTKVILKGYAKHFECPCGYVASNKTGIRLHRRVSHGINPKDLDRSVELHRCNICKEAFGNKFRLLTHGRHMGHHN